MAAAMTPRRKPTERCPIILPNGERCTNIAETDPLGGSICERCSAAIDAQLEKHRVRKSPHPPASDDLEESL
jgi:hypothetical protein